MVALAAAAISGIEGVLHPLLVKAIFDEAASRGSFSHFVGLIFGYLLLGLFLNVGGYGLSLWQISVDNKVVHRISSELLESFYSKDYRDILREGHGYYVARIRSDVKDGVVPMLALVRTMATQFARLAALMSVLIFISWKAFLILSAIIPISSIASVIVGRKIREYTSLERDQEAGVLASLTKSISAFKMVKNFNLVPRTLDSFDGNVKTVLTSGYKKSRVIQMLQGASDLTMVVSDFCSLFVGALFVFRRQMTFGSYLAFMNSFWRSATTLMEIFSQWGNLHSYGVTVSRVMDFFDTGLASPYYLPSSGVSVTNIAYSYGAADILSRFSVEMVPGERALVVGRNGSGKTTLANILSGFLAPSTGRVLLPERISSITLPISFPPIKASELGADARFLDQFDLGTPEILGAYADELSAGQQQKLALALALSKDADLYILDEPLANLDIESRSIAMHAILERTQQKMLIVIMHGMDEYCGAFDRVVRLGEPEHEFDLVQ